MKEARASYGRKRGDETRVGRFGDKKRLDELPPTALAAVLRHVARDDGKSCGFQDLLRLGSTCSFFHEAVIQAEDAWRTVFRSCFGKSATEKAKNEVECGRTTWQEKTKENRQALRLRVAARRVKVESEVHTLRQEIYRLQQRLKQEIALIDDLTHQETSLHRAREHHEEIALQKFLQDTYWQPSTVLTSQGPLVQQIRNDAETYANNLRERLSVARLERQTILKALRTRKTKLKSAENRLRALQA